MDDLTCNDSQARADTRAKIAQLRQQLDREMPPTRPSELHYLLLTGTVRSTHDGDVHRIDAAKLMQCYMLHGGQCTVYSPDRHSLKDPEIARMVWLMPRTTGDYAAYRAFAERIWRRKFAINFNQGENHD